MMHGQKKKMEINLKCTKVTKSSANMNNEITAYSSDSCALVLP
jgi:hypothetical protein